jgi:hypothetical protein
MRCIRADSRAFVVPLLRSLCLFRLRPISPFSYVGQVAAIKAFLSLFTFHLSPLLRGGGPIPGDSCGCHSRQHHG